MEEAHLLRRIRHRRPASTKDLLNKCRVSLKLLGAGSYRDVYHILGTQLVVKIPQTAEDVNHSRNEYLVWRRIRANKNLVALRPALPEFLYHNRNTGVTVMRKYRPVADTKAIRSSCRVLNDEIALLFSIGDPDVHYGNLGRDKDGSLKFIDMGRFLTGMD